MAIISIDTQEHAVAPDQNLLQVCLSLGYDLPYFCWHPALGSVGACRQCAVKQFGDAQAEKEHQGRIVMACMTPAEDGTRISIADPEATAFRARVIEWLMVNHPHDCPVCDEGGQCHLQDMTVMTGHTYRRYRFPKRTFYNQYLGPFLNHEMNRCIQCYRCVRFYRDYAGGRDLNAFASHEQVYFGRYEDGCLENEYSGNLVEVCPTGVFTDKTLKPHYTRKWDLQTAPSVCVHCGLGCNIIPGERYGQLRQVLNRYNGAVNGYFLCDRGRFGSAFVNSDRRIRQPIVRRRDTDSPVSPARETVVERTAAWLSDSPKVIGIGSPRASLEANFALRTLVGPDNFSHGLTSAAAELLTTMRTILRTGPARSPSLRDIEHADAVLVLGEDVTNVAPRLALALRQSVRQKPLRLAEQLKVPAWHDAAVREVVQHERGPLFLATLSATKLDEIATRTYRAAPDDIARLGFVVAQLLSPDAPAVPEVSDAVRSLAEDIAEALKAAERPLVVSGTSCGSLAVIQAAANVAWALCCDSHPADLCFTVPECNSSGLSFLGGQSLDAVEQALEEGQAETLVILENDLYRRAEPRVVDRWLAAAKHVIAIDHLVTATTAKAEVVLPAATFAEADGTVVNNEGRAQRFFQVFAPPGAVDESWRWIRDMLCAVGRDEARGWQSLADVQSALAEALPLFAPIVDTSPPILSPIAGWQIPRQPHRSSGRTAMHAHLNVHEAPPPTDPDSPLAFSMEGDQDHAPTSLTPFFWAPGWNSVQALNKFQHEVGGPLRDGDPGVRLIEPAHNDRPAYFHTVPSAFTPHPQEWLIVPLFHIFGSEELSRLSPAIAERSPQPYLALHPGDAARLQVGPEDHIELSLGRLGYCLGVAVRADLPRGVAGLSVGSLIGAASLLPHWGTLAKRVPGGGTC